MISRYCRQRSLIGGVLRSRARFHATSCSDEDICVLAPTPRLQCILDPHGDAIVSCTVCGERIRGAVCVAEGGGRPTTDALLRRLFRVRSTQLQKLNDATANVLQGRRTRSDGKQRG